MPPRRKPNKYPKFKSRQAPQPPNVLPPPIPLPPPVSFTPSPPPSPPQPLTIPFSPRELALRMGVAGYGNEYAEVVDDEGRCKEIVKVVGIIVNVPYETRSAFQFEFLHAYLPFFMDAFAHSFRQLPMLNSKPYFSLLAELLSHSLTSKWFRAHPSSRSVEFLHVFFGSLGQWFPTEESFTNESLEGDDQLNSLHRVGFASRLASLLLLHHHRLPSNPNASLPSVTEFTLIGEFRDRLLALRNHLKRLLASSRVASQSIPLIGFFSNSDVTLATWNTAVQVETEEEANHAAWTDVQRGLRLSSWFQCELPGCSAEFWKEDGSSGEMRACARCLAVRYGSVGCRDGMRV